MRIISQNYEDIPYLNIVVYVDDNEVMYRPIPDFEKRAYILGEYESERRAMEVFAKINHHFDNYSPEDTYPNTVFRMPYA